MKALEAEALELQLHEVNEQAYGRVICRERCSIVLETKPTEIWA
ncbi:MAG: hypothetical protein AB1813_25435 [Verrucomicrobiota bacterium]